MLKSALPVAPPLAARPRARRAGRLLVEVLLSMVLLAIGASACVTLVRANLMLTDRVAFLAVSRATTRLVAEQLQISPCAASAGAYSSGRSTIDWTPSVSGPLVAVQLSAHGAPHPGGLSAPRTLAAELAGWCR
jgi:Tfp pilus assembly protein PilV